MDEKQEDVTAPPIVFRARRLRAIERIDRVSNAIRDRAIDDRHGPMCNRAPMWDESETLWGSTAKLFGERPRDNRFNPREPRPKSGDDVIREQDGDRPWT
jgi:hypothetical protein